MNRSYDEPGWIELTLPDGRRGVWMRVGEDKVELCAGREGDDAYVCFEPTRQQYHDAVGILECHLFSLELAFDNAASAINELLGDNHKYVEESK